MHFSKNFFFILLAIAATIHSHQLHAMEKAMTAMLEGTAASDFQIYQFLSAATQDNPDCYIPADVTKIIAKNACKITKKLHADCYQRHGMCLKNPDSFLHFIEDGLEYFIPHKVIANILKACLSHSGKSLSDIQYYGDKTVLHCLYSIKNPLRLDCIKIICRVAGDQAWDLIKTEDEVGYTVLHLYFPSAELINELLSFAPSPEELWKLTYMYTNIEDTVLHILVEKSLIADSIKKLLDSAPSREEAWSRINERNCYRKTPLDLANKHANKEVIELLESYRPKEH